MPDCTKPLPEILIGEVQRHSPRRNLTTNAQTNTFYYEFEIYTFKITTKSLRSTKAKLWQDTIRKPNSAMVNNHFV